MKTEELGRWEETHKLSGLIDPSCMHLLQNSTDSVAMGKMFVLESCDLRQTGLSLMGPLDWENDSPPSDPKCTVCWIVCLDKLSVTVFWILHMGSCDHARLHPTPIPSCWYASLLLSCLIGSMHVSLEYEYGNDEASFSLLPSRTDWCGFSSGLETTNPYIPAQPHRHPGGVHWLWL